MINPVFSDAIFAAGAALGFSAVSNPPKKALYIVPFVGACGHAFRYAMMNYLGLDIIFGSLLAAFLIGLISTLCAFKVHCPSEVFSYPALLPMIPGLYAYRSLLGFIKFVQVKNIDLKWSYVMEAMTNGITAILILFALCVGVAIPLFIFYKQSFQMTRHGIYKTRNCNSL
ncbi:threonine/serine exporter family protein [Porphyromonas pogonae]|uniref:threonine/serine exporter family protein n=1 Tax=Porphyromonas pogonae TaxID=867595 RepID=UPI002E789410|nr:threonine/serine exporter family protein [Porphyromonas pogonae]